MSPHVSNPSFSQSVVQDKRTNGYRIETFHFSKDDRVPGLIVLNSGVVEFLDNPANNSGASRDDRPWESYEVGKFDSLVAIIAVDITGNGLMDLLLCHRFDPTMLECDMRGGYVSWLENPGRDELRKNTHWTERFIGRWPAVHRLKA
ncbi:hypothetical protein F4779DRAFT_622640 [Xylariaceae sp. FL0662B]|nr:hypothetical protein F4779DRAFT_622640 [Xylariaceae sp. FL0662B]